jgi:hypothetical protein
VLNELRNRVEQACEERARGRRELRWIETQPAHDVTILARRLDVDRAFTTLGRTAC